VLLAGIPWRPRVPALPLCIALAALSSACEVVRTPYRDHVAPSAAERRAASSTRSAATASSAPRCVLASIWPGAAKVKRLMPNGRPVFARTSSAAKPRSLWAASTATAP